MKKIKVMSVFSGVGGLEQGLNKEKFDVIGHSEINKSACLILNYHYPDIKNYGDITKLNKENLPDFDMLVGGSPCQNLSMAGNKKGLAGSKSGLFFTFARLLEEKQPDYFIWENVKGTFYSNNGLDFFSVLQHFNKLGYHIQWQLLNAEDFGVAQVRNRVFVFGAKKKEDLPGLINVINGSKTKNKSLKFSHFCGSLINEGLVQTITASYGALSGNGTKIIEVLEPTKENLKKIIDSKEENDKVRLLTHNEAEKLMGWGKDWTKLGRKEDGTIIEISERERYRAIGNGIVSNCIKVLTENFDFSKKVFEKNTSIEDMSNYMINGIKDKNDIEDYKMMLRNLKLIENIDYIIKGKRLYILNFKFVNELLNNEKLKKTVLNLKHPLKGMLDINNEYMKTKQHVFKSLKNTTKLSNFLDKGKKNKKYLSQKECEYIYSKIK